jgi:hypothetical protein
VTPPPLCCRRRRQPGALGVEAQVRALRAGVPRRRQGARRPVQGVPSGPGAGPVGEWPSGGRDPSEHCGGRQL